METYVITNEQIQSYAENLRMEERSESTVQKYANALTAFYEWLAADKSVTKERLLAWKAEIGAKNAASTVNVMISAVNSFFAFMSWDNLRVKQVKTQRRIYRDKDRELTKAEYMRLLNAARDRGNLRLYYLMQTLGSTGIRVSELPYITVETLKTGSATVDCKGKRRTVLIPKKLRKILLSYCQARGLPAAPYSSPDAATQSTAPTSGGKCGPYAPPPMWSRTRYSHITSATCSRCPTTGWRRTWRSWPTSSATPALTPRAFTLWRAARSMSARWKSSASSSDGGITKY